MMRSKERGASKASRRAYMLFAYAAAAVIIVSGLLWLSISLIDGADNDIKLSPDAPESLVSVGAPRSQLALERRFSSMSRSYTENGKKVFEPITEAYLASVEDRVADGEKLSLSVEEILYVIADSSELYDEYDIIRLYVNGGDVKDISSTDDLAYGNSPYCFEADERINDILSVIRYRILSLSSPDSYTERATDYLYMPENKAKAEGQHGFVISKGGSGTLREAIVFNADSGRRLCLYPTDEDAMKLDITVLCESKRAFTADERRILVQSGYVGDNYRNVTPEYFYGRTDMRLAVSTGEVIIIDVQGQKALATLSKSHGFMSVALADTDGDGSEELFFTSTKADGSGSALWTYASGGSAAILTETLSEYVGVYENGNNIELYEAKRLEMKKYIRALVRQGAPVWKNN